MNSLLHNNFSQIVAPIGQAFEVALAEENTEVTAWFCGAELFYSDFKAEKFVDCHDEVAAEHCSRSLFSMKRVAATASGPPGLSVNRS